MKTLHIRIKDKHAKVLCAMAREVNMVWNYCNDLSYRYLKRHGKFLSGFDLQKYTAGTSKEGTLIGSKTISIVGQEYAIRRKQFKKNKLSWRSKRSLGWIPFSAQCIKCINGQLRYAGHHFKIRDSYGLSKYELRSGNFAQDSRGRWYANICVETEQVASEGTGSVGIDLGLKDFAVLSNGEKIDAQHFYRNQEQQLATAQRANKKQRVKAIHAKIKAKRSDFLHKVSSRLVKENAAIFVGNVNSSALAKTKMAKSVLDAGWSMFRTMLRYKCDSASVWFEEVNEKYTTQTCSSCGVIPDSSPKGFTGLNKRMWVCSTCGATHDRDINAAANILARGHSRLAEGSR